MKSISALLLILSVACPSLVLAWGFHDAMDYGSPIAAVTPKSSAMGGVWSMPSGGPASIFLNPAELSTLDSAVITVGTGVIQWSTFTYGEHAFSQILSGTILGTATAAIGFRLSDRISMGAGVARVSDFGFEGESLEITLNGPGRYRVYAASNLDSRGSLWEVNTGMSFKLSNWLIAGASGGLRSGSGSWTLVYNLLYESVPNDTTSLDWDELDFCAHIGVLMPLEIGTFGISGTNASGRYRSRVAIGYQKDLEILNGSTLGFEVDVQSIEDDNPEVSGKFFAVFAEMIPKVRSIYSVGFDRASDYKRAGLCLSTGACIDLGRMDLDMAISWRSRSRAGFSFPEPHLDNIDDSGTYYNIGLNWKL
ncbi:MAG: hypothetical protein K8R76_12955 [Candidatus Aegiribacteria sp.]|nr:hypothetical protein [Candidatus Aegiribacteria sp.]